MKCYVWVHSHLSSAQKAVQAAHVVTEMAVNHYYDEYVDWATGYKTIVLLDGGNSARLKAISEEVIAFHDAAEEDDEEARIPYGVFYEDEDTLAGNLTAVCCVLDIDKLKPAAPPTIYNMVQSAKTVS